MSKSSSQISINLDATETPATAAAGDEDSSVTEESTPPQLEELVPTLNDATDDETNVDCNELCTATSNPPPCAKKRSPKSDGHLRCQICRKRVGLTGITCRCGGLFCSEHRYSDKHNCTFDYKEMGAEEIRKNNPVVVGEKIRKI